VWADDHVEIEAFNRALGNATRRMNNNATLALWDDDGVSLMRMQHPIVGKPAIQRVLESVVKELGTGQGSDGHWRIKQEMWNQEP
jgi:ketosteroid isomerase-like protein